MLKDPKRLTCKLSDYQKQAQIAAKLAHTLFGECLAEAIERARAENAVVVVFQDEILVSKETPSQTPGQGQQDAANSSGEKDKDEKAEHSEASQAFERR